MAYGENLKSQVDTLPIFVDTDCFQIDTGLIIIIYIYFPKKPLTKTII